MNVPRVPVLQVVSCHPVLPPPVWLVYIGRGVDRTYNTSSNTSQENKWFYGSCCSFTVDCASDILSDQTDIYNLQRKDIKSLSYFHLSYILSKMTYEL